LYKAGENIERKTDCCLVLSSSASLFKIVKVLFAVRTVSECFELKTALHDTSPFTSLEASFRIVELRPSVSTNIHFSVLFQGQKSGRKAFISFGGKTFQLPGQACDLEKELLIDGRTTKKKLIEIVVTGPETDRTHSIKSFFLLLSFLLYNSGIVSYRVRTVNRSSYYGIV